MKLFVNLKVSQFQNNQKIQLSTSDASRRPGWTWERFAVILERTQHQLTDEKLFSINYNGTLRAHFGACDEWEHTILDSWWLPRMFCRLWQWGHRARTFRFVQRGKDQHLDWVGFYRILFSCCDSEFYGLNLPEPSHMNVSHMWQVSTRTVEYFIGQTLECWLESREHA